MKAKRLAAFLAVALGLFAPPVLGQTRPTGYLSVFIDHLPNRDATELRARALAEEKVEAGPHLRLTVSGFAEGLLADRRGRVTDAIAEPQDVTVEFHTKRFDLLAGLGRIVWGRLDELQPTDVINPIEVSRFLFEGRSEARLPVPLVRGRVFATDKVSIEAVYVPVFRKGRFDRLAEPTSPFNLEPAVPFADATPERTLANAQGGVRLNATTGRVDWSVSTYRGFRPFGLFATVLPGSHLDFCAGASLAPAPQKSRCDPEVAGVADAGITRTYPRFTMVGGDIETVAGPWVIRGEVAAFVRDAFQAADIPIALTGHSLDAGAAVDRKAGDYRLSGQIIIHREAYNTLAAAGRTDVSLVVSADRSFARQKYQGRLFGVYNPNNDSGFVRGIATASLRDNVALEGSLGWFAGTGLDTISRFSDSDFAYLRLKYFF